MFSAVTLELLVIFPVKCSLGLLLQRLTAHLHATENPPYIINLDPAVNEVPFPVNIDIQDTVKYKEVMKQYGLGPNGGIMTALNLFTTKFDQVRINVFCFYNTFGILQHTT